MIGKLEREFEIWSSLKVVGHVCWITGVLLLVANFLTYMFYGLSAMVLGFLFLLAGEYRRGKIADRLEAISNYCDDGRDEVFFRRGIGPGWKRLNKPWLK